MVAVARCESGFRQYEKDGRVLKSHYGTDDWGVFQINKKYHLADARKMGMDVDTLEGNIAYAKYLYKKNGLRDWKWSRKCWEGEIARSIM